MADETNPRGLRTTDALEPYRPSPPALVKDDKGNRPKEIPVTDSARLERLKRTIDWLPLPMYSYLWEPLQPQEPWTAEEEVAIDMLGVSPEVRAGLRTYSFLEQMTVRRQEKNCACTLGFFCMAGPAKEYCSCGMDVEMMDAYNRVKAHARWLREGRAGQLRGKLAGLLAGSIAVTAEEQKREVKTAIAKPTVTYALRARRHM